MCRQIVLIGNGRGLEGVRIPLIRSLVESSKFDPHSSKLFGPSDASHSDGWGFVRVVLTGNGVERISVERSLKPMYRDEWVRHIEEMKVPENVGAVEMIHARAASSGVVDVRTTHPIEVDTTRGYRLFLVHNGSVDKLELLKRLGIDGEGSYAKIYSDTYFLAQLMAQLIDQDITREVIADIATYTRTALNIGAILVKDREVQVVAGSYYKVLDKPIERRNYYRLYRACRNSLILYSSSTLIDFYRPDLDLEWNEVPNGLFEIYRLKFDEKLRVEKVSELLVGR